MLSVSDMRRFQAAFAEEMNIGLAKNPPRKSCFQMINTFVPLLSSSGETGDFLSLDLGSTNFRVLLSQLRADGEDEFSVRYYEVPVELRIGQADKVFSLNQRSIY